MKNETETCLHAWVYDHRDYENMYMRCIYCHQIRPTYPGECAARVSRELRIRHDDKDGDV